MNINTEYNSFVEALPLIVNQVFQGKENQSYPFRSHGKQIGKIRVHLD